MRKIIIVYFSIYDKMKNIRERTGTMIGLGTAVNTGLVVLGSLLGIFLKKAIPERLKNTLVQALALSTVAIGLIGIVTAACTAENGAISSRYTVVTVLSMAIGTFIGEMLNIEKRLDSLGNTLNKKFSALGANLADGFITASLIFCVGSMAIVGSLQDGINGDASILITKGLLDGVMSVVLSSTLGAGVILSAAAVLVYQGIITACAAVLAPFLTDTVIAQMSLTGGILIMGIGLNLIYPTKLRLANMLPSVFVPFVFYLIGRLF